jgi:hypothetical protein
LPLVACTSESKVNEGHLRLALIAETYNSALNSPDTTYSDELKRKAGPLLALPFREIKVHGCQVVLIIFS